MPRFSDTKTRRVIFLDNLRYFFVLCVVLEHACNAYRGMDWWPVAEASASLPVIFLSAFFDSFSMPLLFYVAGYFALPSIRKQSVLAFLTGKLKRLGIPWLVCILTICPMLALIYHYTRDGFVIAQSYGSIWLDVMNSAFEFKVGVVPSMNQLMMHNGFYQRYMWFLSLLVLFFFIFAALYLWKKPWFDAASPELGRARQGIWPTLKLFLAIGFITSLLSFPTVGLIMALGPKGAGPEPLFNLASIIQFRPSRLFFYLVYFALGVLTFRNNWVGRGKFPGHLGTWVVLFTLMLVGFLVIRYLMLVGPEELKPAYGAMYFLALNFMTIATLGCFMALAHRFWNQPTGFDRDMASHSYNIYLGHYIFVIGMQAVLLALPQIPGFLKFIMVSALALVLSYATSRFLLKPFPRLSIATAFALLVFMVLVFQPAGS